MSTSSDDQETCVPGSRRADFQAISTAIAQIYKTYYGRGPTKVIAGHIGDAIVCLLEGVNTPSQAALLKFGKFDTALRAAVLPSVGAIVMFLLGRGGLCQEAHGLDAIFAVARPSGGPPRSSPSYTTSTYLTS